LAIYLGYKANEIPVGFDAFKSFIGLARTVSILIVKMNQNIFKRLLALPCPYILFEYDIKDSVKNAEL
jgi:hypothetical protein